MDEEKKEGEEVDNEPVEHDKEPIEESVEDNHKTPEEPVKESPEPAKEFPKDSQSLTDKLRKNPFIVSTIICGVLAVFLLIAVASGGITGKVVSGEVAGENLIEYLNNVADSDVTLIDVEDTGDFYLATIEFKGQEMPIYITKDGAYYTSNLIPLGDVEQDGGDESLVQEEYSEEDLEKISIFITCLAEKDVKIYGANWCGWTKRLVIETLGGFDVAAPIYVECTENEELCSSEGIQGYPTIKIGGELYEDPRTFEGFAEATGCTIPEVNTIQSSTEESSC
jgi:hypothetical protein